MRGVDLMSRVPEVIRISGQEYPLSFAGGEVWAILEERYGGPLLKHTVPTVLNRLIDGQVTDVLFVAWCGLRHLGHNAPSIEEVAKVPVFEILVGEGGVGDGPLIKAILQVLPKQMAPGPTVAEGAGKIGTRGAKTGTGSALFTWLRWFSGGRKSGSGRK